MESGLCGNQEMKIHKDALHGPRTRAWPHDTLRGPWRLFCGQCSASSTRQAVCPQGLFRPWDKGRLKPEPRLKITHSADPLRARGGPSKWGKPSLGLAPLPPKLVGPSVSQEKPLLTQARGGQVHRLPPVLGASSLSGAAEVTARRTSANRRQTPGAQRSLRALGSAPVSLPPRAPAPSLSSRRDTISCNPPAFSPAQVSVGQEWSRIRPVAPPPHLRASGRWETTPPPLSKVLDPGMRVQERHSHVGEGL